MMRGLGAGWEVCVVVGCVGDCSAPIWVLENMSRGISSAEDGGLGLGYGDWEDS